MSNASAQKKDSAKEPAQRATKPVSKPNNNRQPAASRPAVKNPPVTKPTTPAAAGKKGTATTTPAKAPPKHQLQRVPNTGKTNAQKDSSRKKDTTVKALRLSTAKKDTTGVKKPGVATGTGIKQDSLTHTTRKASVKKDTLNRIGTVIPHLAAADSTRIRAAIADSLKNLQQLSALERNFNLTKKILAQHPYYAFAAAPVITPYSKRPRQPGEEIYFYTLAGIMLLFAGFKTAFSKYFDDLTTLFFRRTLKQRQLQQQLSQNTLPSFLFNILFVFVAGYYLALMATQLATHKPAYPFWQLFAFAVAVVSLAYLAKFFLLKLFGWLFKLQHLTDAYIFLIFLVSKILVLFLLPVLIITSLGGTGIKTIIWTLSWLTIAGLFIYRFIVALQMVQKSNKISLFHFFIYFVAFELLPAFVIYKFILHFLTENSVPLHPI
ncbi:DUF4271 domain-containing protein [Niabella hirudinis]|uniref:DUF4271 domain-containing protein n=1 Tax=Niabella hirudinis TaxID=1285929 RepID=UPI003EB77366